MEKLHAYENGVVSTNHLDYGSDGSCQSETCNIYESKTLGDDIIDDLDSYMEDINDRLTISRMVSDSIIRGMINAVSQEAAEVVGAKELEVARLKEVLCRIGYSEIDASITLSKHDDIELQEHGIKSLGVVNLSVKEQLERLGQCIAKAGNFEKSLIMKNDLDEAFYCLKATLKALCQRVNEIVYPPESSVEEWKVELDICQNVEAMVFSSVVQGLQCEYEKQIWDVSNNLVLNDRFNVISSLRHELDSIQKCFVGPEVGNLSSQGSAEMDHFHRKVSSNHGLPSAQLSNGNGNGEESKVFLPENFETSPLKHMTKQDLYQHFRTVITEMKRGHESTVQQMTDVNFSLRRELLKERELMKEKGSFAAFKKDKDFENLKKKIPEVIAKLDDIVRENEKLSEFCNHSKDTMGSLLTENCHLKNLLRGQIIEHSRAEENLQRDHKSAISDEHIKASISEEVYKCIIREMDGLINCTSEDGDVKSRITQDVCGTHGDFHPVVIASESDYEEFSCLQSSIIQQINGIIYQEALEDMSMELTGLKDRCLTDSKSLDFLQRKVSEIENELAMKVEENIDLKHQVLVLESSVKEKEKSLLEITVLLEKDKVQFTAELDKLLHLRAEQEALISDKNEELVLLKGKMEDYLKQIDSYTLEVDNLNQGLKSSEQKLRMSNEEKTKLISVLELKQIDMELMKDKDDVHIKHLQSLCHVIQGLSKSFGDFELRIKESIGWHNVRLENSAFQLQSLIPKVNVLRRTGFLYKERLEKKCSDLQKAESEVDLLGDEVDALLSLLEKIYVALDHYSPILQHYPGIIEILKLVKRELSGEAVKAG
ncbi:WPP domain-associated protein-like [Chenopodium quinoa]|uniref:WPP domain-associated protein n=1 Tax=Chenopodium quinoa TaxID=63459 RepID=A0A803MV70_CHEQI|nr:WPP domain-associated protein-like [Chenopodium quinoa]